jgi:hypothetical protein
MNARNFKVKGKVTCLYGTDPATVQTKLISNINVELWRKAAAQTIFIGSGSTDELGNFNVEVEVDSPVSYIVNGKINEVFIKAYYKGVLITNDAVPRVTINEGYTDIGNFDVNITSFEFPVEEVTIPNSNLIGPPPDYSILFKLKFASGVALPPNYNCVFTVLGRVPDESVEIKQNTNTDGFIQIVTPSFPIVKKLTSNDTSIHYHITGPLDRRTEEAYLEVRHENTGQIVYSLIHDFVIHNEFLQLKDSAQTYYKIQPEILIDVATTAIHITKRGQVYGYSTTTNSWRLLSTLVFNMFARPAELISVTDGFYSRNGNEGALTQAGLDAAGTVLAGFTGTVMNAEPFLANINLQVLAPDASSVYTNAYTNLVLGTLNFIPVTIPGSPAIAPDTSPTLTNIQQIAGITFSPVFTDFLSTRQLTSVDKVRKAGPIKYIDGFPASVIPEQVNALQSHVDLFSLNANALQNQRIISRGYNSILSIADAPKNTFINAVVNTDLPLFQAAKIHEIAVQNKKLVSNLLAGTLSDLRLANPSTPEVSNSSFARTALSRAVNSCGCDDCKSNISPFAYLMELIDYGSKHIDHSTASPSHTPGSGKVSFVNLITDKFLQPFGTLNVDCKTLHDTFCRVRLVTEVFEKLVDIKTLANQIPALQLAKLTAERNQFLLLTYRNLLIQAGTSIEELRDIVTKPTSEKVIAAQAFSDKLGIPLYVPLFSTLCVDKLWLTFNNVNLANELNAQNLEIVFGFRDTKRNVLTATPVSLMENLRAAYLRTLWRNEDYKFTAYSREEVVPANLATYKANWKPIVDPDIMGWQDLTYNTLPFVKSLWQLRKEETDVFLKYCISAPTVVSKTSADINARILKVLDRDIVSHTIENDDISILNSASVWSPFKVLNRALNTTNTDVVLRKATAAIPQPVLFQPNSLSITMRYNRVVTIASLPTITANTPFVINFPEPVIADQLGYAKLTSTGATGVIYQTTTPGTSLLTVTFTSSTSITLTLGSVPTAAFLAGTIRFTYTVSVPLDTTDTVDVEKLTTELFNTNQSYVPLAPAVVTNPFTYRVWTAPSTWPSVINAPTLYGKLKQMYQFVLANQNLSVVNPIITTNLRLTRTSFIRVMQLMDACEKYLSSMYSFKRPSVDELYEMASIIRTSARLQLNPIWVQEEIRYIDTATTLPFRLMLSKQHFWKSLVEPSIGVWDSSLQNMPSTVAGINAFHVPVVDPELLNFKDINVNPEAKIYRDLHIARKLLLDTQYTTYLGFVTAAIFDSAGFIKIFNHINTGTTGTTTNIAVITPYTTFLDIVNDAQSPDLFKQKKASDLLWSAFRLTNQEFLEINVIRTIYELNDPTIPITPAQFDKVIKLLVTAFKRKRLYVTIGASIGWIEQEIVGNYISGGVPVKYYNVLKTRLANWRSDVSNRVEWQQTLEAWNRLPIIHPDIVPPENIKNFIPSNWVYTTWNSRFTALNNAVTALQTALTPATYTNANLFTALKAQINLIIARVDSFTPILPNNDFLIYFTNIELIESAGEDIRPYLEQLGISISEYRFLAKIYKLTNTLNTSAPTGTPPILDSEKTDVIDILISIRSRNLLFKQVQEEYNATNKILLCQDFFQIYKASPINFPLTDLPVYNQWRSPHTLRKNWKNTLESRIDREKGVKDAWKEILQDVEDRNMPLLRDALIRALTNPCENWQDAAERLAKTYFVETKDNCCVKHTRVSFAIETLQGLFFALQNGVFDGFITNFKLVAQHFEEEWKWLGSYASWRAAVFTFIYPENILYPTLKRKQSTAFIELAETLSSANRFSPEDACKAAQEYQNYLEDIQNIEPICSTFFNEYQYFDSDGNDCCVGIPNSAIFKSYIFGQGQSGTVYYCPKVADDVSGNSIGMWNKLPIENKTVRVLGAMSLGDIAPNDNQTNPNYGPENAVLYLYYTYVDKGKIILAYISKSLTKPNAKWSQEKQTPDIPTYLLNREFEVTYVTLCQSNKFWEKPTFIFSYLLNGVVVSNFANQVNPNIVSVHREYNHKTDTFEQDTYGISTSINPVTALRLNVRNSSFLNPRPCLVIAYDNVIFLSEIAVGNTSASTLSNSIIYTINNNASSNVGDFKKIIGVYSKADNQVIVVYKDNSDTFKVCRIEISQAATIGFTISEKNNFTAITPMFKKITKIYPIFSENNTQLYFFTNTPNPITSYTHPYFVIKSDTPYRIICSGLYTTTTGAGSGAIATLISMNDPNEKPFAIVPEDTVNLSIQSGECIQNFNSYTLNVKTKLLANFNAPLGTSASDIVRVVGVKELLYEAYYFVPMLLALDQQKRGQYKAALNWYRSVYNYTLQVTPLANNRKVFYGLVLEETITNSFTHAPNWLLDPLNPHLIAQTRSNAYTKYTVMNIVQCLFAYADREFTLDTIESVPIARKLYREALDLLSTAGLSLKANACVTISNDCIDSQTNYGTQRLFGNGYSQLKDKIQALGTESLAQTISTQVAVILNQATPDTAAQKLAEAFDYVLTNTPATPIVETVMDVVNLQQQRLNNAASYVLALNDTKAYNDFVSVNYTNTVATISRVDVQELNSSQSATRLAWLTNPESNNSQPYNFRFADPISGIQLLPGNSGYNPLNPTSTTYSSNSNYSNAPEIIEIVPIPPVYTPLIDFVFCMPSNPVYGALELKGNLEMYKIFNCRNIAGMVRELDVFAAATDSTSGLPVIGGNGLLNLPGQSSFSPSQYRFRVLIERAKQIASQAQQMESLFLSALEKEDNENYSQLRAKQDLETSKATIRLQDLRITQAKDELSMSSLQLDKVTFIQNHYYDLIASGLNDFEFESISLMADQVEVLAESLPFTTTASIANSVFSIANLQGVGDLGSSAFSAWAQKLGANSGLNSLLASFQRRSQEWNFQKDLAGFDISLANQQIKISDDNIRIVTQEREIAVLNNDHAKDSLEFIKNKFTNAELYNWMGNVLERSYNYMLNLSTAIARTAEGQLYFERQEQAGPFVLNDYWETPSSGNTAGSSGKAVDRRGLTGSARLLVDITRLDQYAFETNKRKLQLSKTISLSQNFPSEFQRFKETGVLYFDLTNKLFDYDFPGHYLRLINSVKTTVVGLLPVYDGIKATLTAAATSYTVIGGNTFQRIPIRRAEIDSVALSSANNATGLFELQPAQGELLNPFEGMGIESRWEFKMPQFSNRMDYDNIADVLINVEYTALDSYQYRYQVLQDLDDTLSFNRGFSLKTNFPDQWYELGEAVAGTPDFSTSFELKREFFPQGIDNLRLNGSDIVLYFVRDNNYTQEVKNVDIRLASATTGNTNLESVNGIIRSNAFTSAMGTNPLNTIKLVFNNDITNREIFSKGKVKDIILLVGCKADLRKFPI